MSDITPTQELDCRKMNCPLPVLKFDQALGSMSSGDVLKVVATDPGSVADMAAFSRSSGHILLDNVERGGEFVFFIQKK